MPTVRKFLDVSTAHLTPDAKAWLTARSLAASVYEGCYGWFAHCEEDPDNLGQILQDETRPAVLTAIFQHAVCNGCDYVLFDADAEADHELPRFDDEDDPLDRQEGEDQRL